MWLIALRNIVSYELLPSISRKGLLDETHNVEMFYSDSTKAHIGKYVQF